MRCTADREELGQALDNAKENGLKYGQASTLGIAYCTMIIA